MAFNFGHLGKVNQLWGYCMRFKNLVIRISLLLCAVSISIPQSFAQQTTTEGTGTLPSIFNENKPTNIALAQFINDTLKEMDLPDNVSIPGLSDAEKLLLENFKKVNQATFTATASIKNIPFEIIKYTPSGKPKPLLIIGIKEFDLSKSIPGISGTPLGTLGALENAAFIYSPEKFSGQLSLDSTVKTILGQASSGVNLSPGMNLIASVSTANFSSEIKELMKSVGDEPNRKISFSGKISPNIFKNIHKGSAGTPSELASSEEMKSKIQTLLNDYGKDFLSSLDLSGDLPQSLKAGPIELKGGKFILRGGKTGNTISLGI